MATRHHRKSKTDAGKVYDRRSADLPINAEVVAVKIVDPYGDDVVAMQSTRDDPLVGMLARRQIDEAQFQAGRAYQRDWESAERGPRAIDPTKEAVDGGRMPEPITEAQQRAARNLNRVIKELGTDGACIIHDVLIGRMTLAQVAVRRGYITRSWAEYFGRRFRECLERLAVVYGLVGKN